MATPEGFARRMREIGRLIEVNTDELTRRVALAVDRAVVLSTPVDEGRARGNWVANIGTAVTEEQAFIEGEGGSTGEANAAAAISQAEAVIRTYEGVGDIFISNNLPYIIPLNEGSSDQAPAGFIEEAVINGTIIAQRTRIVPR